MKQEIPILIYLNLYPIFDIRAYAISWTRRIMKIYINVQEKWANDRMSVQIVNGCLEQRAKEHSTKLLWYVLLYSIDRAKNIHQYLYPSSPYVYFYFTLSIALTQFSDSRIHTVARLHRWFRCRITFNTINIFSVDMHVRFEIITFS